MYSYFEIRKWDGDNYYTLLLIVNGLSKGWNVGKFTKMPPGTAVEEVALLVRGGGSGVVGAAGEVGALHSSIIFILTQLLNQTSNLLI